MTIFGKGQRSYSFDWVKIPDDTQIIPVTILPSSVPVMQRKEKGEGFWFSVAFNRTRVKFGGWKECVILEAQEPGFYIGVDRKDYKEICRRKIKGTKVALMLDINEAEIFALNDKGEAVFLKRGGVYRIEKRPKGVPLH